ncbi:hypothetical protein EV361DRAFT_145167 [Lentinula raphanica]|nr:hypothetical protein EV361DRAFT_145167 [Lentinula raphanica]
MLFLSVHSKLAGFGLLMSLLIVLASPLPMDPNESHESSPIDLMRVATEYDDYFAFGSSKRAVGVVLPDGISHSAITDPCIRGKLQWLDLEHHTDLEWVTVGKIHGVSYADIEKFINDEKEKELPFYFLGGNGAHYIAGTLMHAFELRFPNKLKMDHKAVSAVLQTVNNAAREELFYEKYFKPIPTYRKMDPEYEYCAELEAAKPKTRTVAAAA